MYVMCACVLCVCVVSYADSMGVLELRKNVVILLQCKWVSGVWRVSGMWVGVSGGW